MDLINRDKHLNLFNYYRGGKNTPKENNLSRAFAITLDKNRKFLNEVFKEIVFDEAYSNMFSLDYNLIDKEEIYIDIQTSKVENRASNESDNFEKYIGVLLGDFDEKSISNKEIKEIKPAETKKPIPDIVIGIKNTLVVIENKLYGSGADFPQLKRHVESLSEGSNSEKPVYKPINWSSIIRDAMDIYYESKRNQPFLEDFIQFLRRKHTHMMPSIPLNNINIGEKTKKDIMNLIEQRLEVIKTLVSKNNFPQEDIIEDGKNIAIPIDIRCAERADLSFDEKNKNIFLRMWPADTKGQGKKLFKEDKNIDWFEKKQIWVNNYQYDLKITPCIKFANWRTGKGYIEDELKKDKKFYKTHNYETFNEIAGRYKRNREYKNWKDLTEKLDNIMGRDWRSEAGWDETFINSDKTTIDISFGIKVNVIIPYKKAQKLDESKKETKFPKEIYDILTKLKEMIDQ